MCILLARSDISVITTPQFWGSILILRVSIYKQAADGVLSFPVLEEDVVGDAVHV